MIFAPSNVKDFLFKPGKYFLIPEFQRPYSWRSDNIRSFLSDIEEVASLPADKKHYFGSIVFVNDTKDLNAEVIIDGQQRLTTALLLLMALYHITHDAPDKSTVSAEEVREKYLFNSASYASEDNRIRLRTVTSDDKIFNKLYLREELMPDEKKSRLYQAYRQFYSYLSERYSLEMYVNTLARFDIVTISLNSNDDNPQRVFESINSTGQPLTEGDKIRNFALMLNDAETQQYAYKKYWQVIEHALTDTTQDYITDFFRAYLIVKRGAIIPQGNVYPEFKKHFQAAIDDSQNLESIDAFYGDIVRHLEYYTLAKFGTDHHNKYGRYADFFMKMRYLKIETYYPFSMNVLAYQDSGFIAEDEVDECFGLIEAYISRRIVCGLATTSVDKIFASLHRDILEYKDQEPAAGYYEIMKYMLLSRGGNTRFPRDQELEVAIATNETYHQLKSYVNYILASPGDASRESSVLLQLANKQLPLSIEHIMPQTLTRDWIADLGEDYETIHKKYLHTLANLTLTGYNSRYSNRRFEQKQTIEDGFNDSPLVINAELKKVDRWTEKELLARQKWWQDKIKHLWPEPTTNFKPVEVDTKVWIFDGDDLKGTQPRIVHVQGDTIIVTSWYQVLDQLVDRIFEDSRNKYSDIVAPNELLSKYIRDDPTSMRAPERAADTQYYIEMNSDTNTKCRIMVELMKALGWSRDDLSVELTEKIETDEEAEQR